MSQQVVFDSVQVELWPERDGASVLVSLDLMLSQNAVLPQEMVVQIPASAEVGSLLNVDDRGTVQQSTWVENSGDTWKDIQFTATAHNILIEYTDPALVYFDQLRTFNYLWISNYPVNDLIISISQPYGAGDLVTHPEADEIEPCCTYTIDAGPVIDGISYSVNFHYIKDLENQEFPALSVSSVSPVDENTSGRMILPSMVVVWLLGIALLLILLVGFYYGWYQRRSIKEQGGDGENSWLTRRSEQKAIFCHECGARSLAGDAYCRNCGTELRKMDNESQKSDSGGNLE